jgi:hypothetical protein
VRSFFAQPPSDRSPFGGYFTSVFAAIVAAFGEGMRAQYRWLFDRIVMGVELRRMLDAAEARRCGCELCNDCADLFPKCFG